MKTTTNNEPNNKPNKETYKLYGGKIELGYYPLRHIYSVDEKGVYGVTGITSILPKPWMAAYVRKHAKLYFAANTTNSFEDVGYIDEKGFNEALTASDRYGQAAAQMGTNVHKFVQEWLENKTFPQVNNQQELNSFSAFWKFMNGVKLEPVLLERKIFSKKHQYAGTADFIGLVDGVRTLLDWKTSERIYESYWLQLAAYVEAMNEEIKADQKLKKKIGGEIEQIMIVRLGKDGGLEVRSTKKWDKEFQIFLHLLEVKAYLGSKKDQDGLIK